MSKTIVSPVKKWPGSVTISDPLNISQAMAFEEAINGAKDSGNPNFTSAAYCHVLLPGIFACVEKWELDGLEGVTPDTFPGTPKIASASLIAWLTTEISKLYREADEIPNA